MQQQQHVTVSKFLSSLDTDIPMIEHFRNVMRDAMHYKWSSSIVVSIMIGVEDAYKKKEN